MSKNILVLFSRKHKQREDYTKIFSKLEESAVTRGMDCYLGNLDELWIEVKDNRLKITEPNTGKDLRDFDFIHFNWWGNAKEQALAAAIYLKRHNVPFLTQNLAIPPVFTEKIGEIAMMSDNAVNLPDTFISSHDQIKIVFNNDPPITFPIIVKAENGYGGKNNYLVSNFDELVKILDDNEKIDFVIQEFIPNDCDYRCLIFDKEIKLILRRSRKSNDTHLNNTSAGAEGKIVALDEIDDKSKKMVVQAAELTNRDQFSGVDLLINSKTGRPYILEVNSTPEIEEGAQPDKKIDALLTYIEGELK